MTVLQAHKKKQRARAPGRALALVFALLLSGTALMGVSGAAFARPLDFNDDQPVNIAAKELTHDETGQTVTATGNVEMVQGGKILRADKIVYNLSTDVVSAIGNVALLDETGDVHTAEYVELSGDLKQGYVQGLLSMLADGSRFTAVEARREDGRRPPRDQGQGDEGRSGSEGGSEAGQGREGRKEDGEAGQEGREEEVSFTGPLRV